MADAPAQEEGEKTITLRVRDQSGEEMFFKVKKSTKMDKIMQAYAQRRGLAANALRFMVDGERLTSDQTAKMLELEDDDQIDVMLESTGGF
jgi:small ubiquitin-related modifier